MPVKAPECCGHPAQSAGRGLGMADSQQDRDWRDSEMARDLAENGELWDLGKDERMESNASTRND